MARKTLSYPGLDSIEVRVKGGFPAIYWFKMCGADKSVGLDEHIEEDFVTTMTGHPADWLKLSDKDMGRLREQAFKYMEGIRHSHDYYDN